MRRSTHGALVVALLVVSASSARADFYMYRERSGVLKFTNAPSAPEYRFFMAEVPHLLRLKGFTDPARAKKYDPLIASAADRYKVDMSLIKAVIRAESDFVPQATSPKGAQGLMQLMPATARLHGVVSAYDPQDNVEGGVRHLRKLLDRYGGNVRLAVAAYNAGEGAVDKHGGVPPFPETVNYLERVMRFREVYERQGG
jgi:soluble lytic murein transglycosylase-like protein